MPPMPTISKQLFVDEITIRKDEAIISVRGLERPDGLGREDWSFASFSITLEDVSRYRVGMELEVQVTARPA